MNSPRKYPLVTLLGFVVIILYCSFTLISWAFYPGAYGPLTHYLSRLGDYPLNPAGAIFYNLGCITTGVMIIPFFASFYFWYTEKSLQKVVLAIGQILGMSSGIALIAIGVFSEDTGSPHMTASSVFFIMNFVVLIFLNIGLLLNHDFPKLAGIFGLVLDFSTLLLAFTVGGPITEWYTVFGSLLIVGIIALISYHVNRGKQSLQM